MNENNSSKILSLVAKKLQAKVTQKSVIEELQKHPDPSSLLAISDTLDSWRIPNAAYQATFEELLEAEIPLPFIGCFTKAEFVLVTQINEKRALLHRH